MKQSLIGVTYDLLTYHRYGNYSVFDRCFSKALTHLDVSLVPARRAFYRNWTFHFLRSTGYLEVARQGRDLTWLVTPSSLVQVDHNTFVLLGNSSVLDKLSNVLDKEQIQIVDPNARSRTLQNGALLFPPIGRITGSKSEAEAIAERFDLQLSLNFQDTIFASLPSLDTARDAVLQERDNRQVFEPETGTRFDFETDEWVDYRPMNILDSGLYRANLRFSKVDYYLAVPSRSRHIRVYKVTDPEWIWLFACDIFKRPIPVRYEKSQRLLRLTPNGKIFRIPTLIERALRSGALLPALRDGGESIYQNISQRNLWNLVSKFPVFRVQNNE